mmetsp:Transcript_16960/g.20631  ORF Transcript_16960/g.20631 Transcript_16960/m.20631 type:complete len:744 (+) Transcript_16960:60-2291(+)|eukprot:CAMPEP_0197288406 /NCGR_PEP_ID=MMETSP0890-20130614/5470_1 /TAXON_ID=44058 ORGANISM="Aureoumbra lagunensis, Strain CCMP1510" /NCGR_SAMPLE_ID=MMETSP0890 /ASSEMBLY_ACC=CAM_ASM_000533 /LENGTH=743 /DNA_ID=CAMNT_0042759105 /DNA_START=45 /DNA_END=2276 /DNA_ORIENTATION=-
MSKVAVGIDLGTTYSCVGVWQNNRVEIIANDMGTRIMPSYVAFFDHERVVGDGAKNQFSQHIQNTVYDVKRLIGRKFDEETVQEDMKRWPFEVNRGNNGEPKVKVIDGDKELEFAVEEISAMVLSKLKETAQNYLGREVTAAVITVPAYFNDAQRQATKAAAKIAGLEVLRILNEPTAAALAFGLDKKIEKAIFQNDSTDLDSEQNEFDLDEVKDQVEIETKEEQEESLALIFDLGGGTLDVSILALSRGVFEVKATAGNTHLGGGDFDACMAEYFCTEFSKIYKKDLRTSSKAMGRLHQHCERAKRRLSTNTTATIDIENIIDGIDFEHTISRAKFEAINAHLFKQCLEPVERCLKDARILKQRVRKINSVVLVGGSTRIPKIQQLLSEFFQGKELTFGSVNPDEAVAYGATIQAAVLTGQIDDSANNVLSDILLMDVTPLTLGIEVGDDAQMSKQIKRNTRIPVEKNKLYTTSRTNQTQVRIRIFEGEREFTRDNHFLGQFDLTGIPPAPAGTPQIDVKFSIDANGILSVRATCNSSGSTQQITIQRDAKSHLSPEAIQKMIQDGEKYQARDAAIRLKIDAKSQLETTCEQLKRATWDDTDDLYAKLDQDARTELSDKIALVKTWISKPTTLDLSQPSDFQEKQKDLEDFVRAHLKSSMPPPSQSSFPPGREGAFGQGATNSSSSAMAPVGEEDDDDDDDDLPDLVETDENGEASTVQEEFSTAPPVDNIGGGASWVEEID